MKSVRCGNFLEVVSIHISVPSSAIAEGELFLVDFDRGEKRENESDRYNLAEISYSIQILRSTPAIAESLAGGVAKCDRGE
ncbi:hypothetical protein CKA32_000791 [Geitlerinema sp. FC II]|nr:hypothetical protein CKA32_000791 [Geitlerinema sp. FC II]